MRHPKHRISVRTKFWEKNNHFYRCILGTVVNHYSRYVFGRYENVDSRSLSLIDSRTVHYGLTVTVLLILWWQIAEITWGTGPKKKFFIWNWVFGNDATMPGNRMIANITHCGLAHVLVWGVTEVVNVIWYSNHTAADAILIVVPCTNVSLGLRTGKWQDGNSWPCVMSVVNYTRLIKATYLAR